MGGVKCIKMFKYYRENKEKKYIYIFFISENINNEYVKKE